MSITIYGIAARMISFFVSTKQKHWIFGSDVGMMYREGSRYLLEYMLKEHPDYHCTFITQSKSVKETLGKKGIPCELNFSFRGMITIAKAEVAFMTQEVADIFFVYKKKNRRFIYLGHGQPYKAVFNATPDEYYKKNRYKKRSWFKEIILRITKYFTCGYEYWESSFYVSTSEFLVPYNKMYYGDNANVFVLGMPRNDALFDTDKMSKERWLPNVEGKTVITYMPTHRNYGKGEVSPLPFIHNREVQEWMKRNDVVLLIKQHPNMEFKISDAADNGVIIDISKMKFDPQVVLFHSHALITDYSSVWIDYLILKRPLIFYYYDKYEQEDAGVLYDLKEDPPGHFCYSEIELFEKIKKIKENYDSMRPADRIVHKFHQYTDDNSCKRLFEKIKVE